MNVAGSPLLNPTHQSDSTAIAQQWWRGAVIYQIYPRSFQDTNGDGIGDLNGVIDRLDYVASLGVDAVWLSPFFTSPMRDFGYDVADYCDVDPIFGTLEDFDRLIAKAHSLGLKVIIDQVYSHTSDEHQWFVQSRSSKTNPKVDWFVWADPKPDGSPPNNWQSVFGGPAWTWDGRRGQYYFHNFLSSQPDLNVHNEEVQDALLGVARFWLDRGVNGFRLDAINFAMHDPDLRDNPPAPQDGRGITRPFDLQEHRYNQSHPDIPKFLERMRELTNDYPAIFTVAEIGGPNPLNEMKTFTANDRRLNSAYSFDFLYADTISAALPKSALSAWPGDPNEGWPSWAFSNHDAPRAISRWADDGGDCKQTAKFCALLLMSLRGNVFLYQGEELGLPQANVPFEDLKDPEAIVNWPKTLGRDGARTPLPWEACAPHSGFSDGTPWLPVDMSHKELSVDIQEQDTHSTLNFVRRLISIRNASPALRHGDIQFLDAPDDILAFTRNHDDDELLCVFNLGKISVVWLPASSGQYEILVDVNVLRDNQGLPHSLEPQSGYIARKRH